MPIQKILTLPDPFLKKKASQVTDIDNNIVNLIASMIETMRQHPHCVGLAASQIGLDLRIVVVDASLSVKANPNHGQLTLINPVIVKSSGKQVFREGCLSVPEFTGNVSRASQVTVAYKDIEGKNLTLTTEGFESVVLQHEIDHLDGILFLDRVSSLKTDVFRRKHTDH